MNSRGLAHRTLCVVFVATTGLAYLAAASPAATRGLRYVFVHLVLSAVMLLVWATSRNVSTSEYRWTLASGLFARLLLLACPSFTSVDISRYLWDGHAILIGLDPYRLAPNQAPPALFAGWQFPGVGTHVATIYPPGAQSVFALCALFGPIGAWWAWKIILLIASTATVVVCERLLARRSCPQHLPLVALNPLLVLEAGVGAHVDALAVLALAAALLAGERKRTSLTGVLLAIGGLMKFLPLLAVVPLFFAAKRRDAWRLLLTAAVVFGGAYGLAIGAGYRPVGSLFLVGETWAYGSSLFAWAADQIGDTAARALAAGLAISGLIASGWFGSQGQSMLGIVVAFTAIFTASPVFFPWYLTPMVPVLAAMPTVPVMAWLLSQPLSYAGTGEDGDPWRLVSWMSVAALFWIVPALGSELRCTWAAATLRTPRAPYREAGSSSRSAL